MTAHWTAQLAAHGARIEGEDIVHFGAAEAELAAARDSTVAIPLTHLGLIECTGEDAKSFLHNQLTSDINHLGPRGVQHSAWCTAKGRMLVSFLFYRPAAGYRALLSADLLASTQKRLQMYVLRAKVSISDLSATQALIGVAGPDACSALARAGLEAPADAMSSTENAQGAVLSLSSQRFIAVIPVNEVASAWAALTALARPAGRIAWQWLDIQEGLPLICEATKEAFVPQMADFDRIGGVSFHKGCYPGQEIVARTQYLGKVKRHLFRLTSTQALKPGDVLHSPDNPDQSCGMVMTAAPSPAGGYEALAVVQSNYSENVRLGSLDGPVVKAVAVNP